MIKVKGVIVMRNDFEVVLDMTEEEFDQLRHHEREDEISESINWHDWLEGSDIHDIDVWDIEEVEEEE
jgi:hypothetical protein